MLGEGILYFAITLFGILASFYIFLLALHLSTLESKLSAETYDGPEKPNIIYKVTVSTKTSQLIMLCHVARRLSVRP